MIKILLEGTPFEIGRTHGEHFSARICDIAIRLWEKSDCEATRAAIGNSVEHLGKHFPEINEEIRGIASGAGITFEQAFLLNNRSILGAVLDDGCSHAAVIKNGSAVVGMNKDTRGQEPEDFFVAEIRPSSGHAISGYRHIGRVWGYGVNDAGLCTAGTSAYPAQDRRIITSIGLYFVGPIVLSRCGTAAEAIDLTMRLGSVGESGNVLVADCTDAAVIEFAPDERIVRRPENGVVASTNFYASGRIEHASDPAYLEETRARYTNVLSMAEAGDATVEAMKRILSHHSSAGAVCRHDATADHTVLSFIALPRERRLLIASGPPCRNDYVSYALK